MIDAALFRHVYYNDIVPHLPPLSTGVFDHVGSEYRFHPTKCDCPSDVGKWELQEECWWLLKKGRVSQVPFVLSTLPFALLDALLPNFPLVNNIKMWWSLMDHSPLGYMASLKAQVTE